MAEVYRRHALIDAPLDTVWSVVTDPKTHPDWWPEVKDVRADLIAGELSEGSEYTRRTRRYGFLDVVDNVWQVERMEELKECHFSCTATGTYTRFALTPAQDDTFVEIEANDVRCTHAATVARLDADQVFYLMSRGLTRGEAERLLVGGFLEVIAARLESSDTLRNAVSAALERELETALA